MTDMSRDAIKGWEIRLRRRRETSLMCQPRSVPGRLCCLHVLVVESFEGNSSSELVVVANTDMPADVNKVKIGICLWPSRATILLEGD